MCAEVRRRHPEVRTTRKLGVRRAIGAGVLLGAAAGAGGCAGDAAGMQGKKAVSGCCIVRAAVTGVKRSAVRRRWDERGGDEGPVVLEGCWVGDAVARWREAAGSVRGEWFAAEWRCGRSAESEKVGVGRWLITWWPRYARHSMRIAVFQVPSQMWSANRYITLNYGTKMLWIHSSTFSYV